jgi:hypothetical protein
MHKTFFPSAARNATTYTSSEVSVAGYTGVKLYLTVSAVSSTGTVTPKLQGFSKTSGQWADIPGATFAAINTSVTTTLTLHPAITTVANVAVPQCPGDTIRAIAVVATSTVTFSLGADLIR